MAQKIANTKNGAVASKRTKAHKERKDYLELVPVEAYLKTSRILQEISYLQFLDYMADTKKDNSTLARCQSL